MNVMNILMYVYMCMYAHNLSSILALAGEQVKGGREELRGYCVNTGS